MDRVQEIWQLCCRHHDKRSRRNMFGKAAEEFVIQFTCPVCAGYEWISYPENNPALDLTCNTCNTHFQIKACRDLKPNIITKTISVTGATYSKAIETLGSVAYILVSYNSMTHMRCLYYIPANEVKTECFHPWNALVSNTLCTISFQKGTYKKLNLL